MFDLLNAFDWCMCKGDYTPPTNKKKFKQWEKDLLTVIYMQIFLNDLISMLEYENIPYGLETDYLELMKIQDGVCGVIKLEDGDIVPFRGGFSDKLDHYGRGTHFVGACLDGTDIDAVINEECVIAKNNILMSSDIPNLYRLAKMLVETDISMNFNLFYSRYAPLLRAFSESESEKIKKALADIEVGVPVTIVFDDIDQILEGSNVERVINYTDVKNSDKLQYLSKFHDDILRRFYTYYGHAMSGTEKMAQQSVDEIGRNDTVSMIYPLIRLKKAEEFCESLNKLYGTSMSVDFSQAWNVKQAQIEREEDLDNESIKGSKPSNDDSDSEAENLEE